MKKFLFAFLLFLLIPNNIKSYYCKFDEISRYKSLASNINTYYDYIENDGNISFTITLVNLNEELYIVDSTTNKKYFYNNSELSISGYSAGQSIKYYVYATNQNCNDDLLYTIRINLPDYNPYYSDDVCNDVNNYIYCKKWYKHSLNYEQFVDKVNSYKQSLIKPDVPIIDDSNDLGLWDIIIEIWVKYYYLILLPIIVICGIVIYCGNKKNNIYR